MSELKTCCTKIHGVGAGIGLLVLGAGYLAGVAPALKAKERLGTRPGNTRGHAHGTGRGGGARPVHAHGPGRTLRRSSSARRSRCARSRIATRSSTSSPASPSASASRSTRSARAGSNRANRSPSCRSSCPAPAPSPISTRRSPRSARSSRTSVSARSRSRAPSREPSSSQCSSSSLPGVSNLRIDPANNRQHLLASTGNGSDRSQYGTEPFRQEEARRARPGARWSGHRPRPRLLRRERRIRRRVDRPAGREPDHTGRQPGSGGSQSRSRVDARVAANGNHRQRGRPQRVPPPGRAHARAGDRSVPGSDRADAAESARGPAEGRRPAELRGHLDHRQVRPAAPWPSSTASRSASDRPATASRWFPCPHASRRSVTRTRP